MWLKFWSLTSLRPTNGPWACLEVLAGEWSYCHRWAPGRGSSDTERRASGVDTPGAEREKGDTHLTSQISRINPDRCRRRSPSHPKGICPSRRYICLSIFQPYLSRLYCPKIVFIENRGRKLCGNTYWVSKKINKYFLGLTARINPKRQVLSDCIKQHLTHFAKPQDLPFTLCVRIHSIVMHYRHLLLCWSIFFKQFKGFSLTLVFPIMHWFKCRSVFFDRVPPASMTHPIIDSEMDMETRTVKDRVGKLRGIYTWGMVFLDVRGISATSVWVDLADLAG